MTTTMQFKPTDDEGRIREFYDYLMKQQVKGKQPSENNKRKASKEDVQKMITLLGCLYGARMFKNQGKALAQEFGYKAFARVEQQADSVIAAIDRRYEAEASDFFEEINDCLDNILQYFYAKEHDNG